MALGGGNRYKIISALFGLMVIALLSYFYYSPVADYFNVEFKIKTNYENNIKIQLFYTLQGEQDPNFNGKKMETCIHHVNANMWSKVKCSIPLPRHQRVAKLRIDTGEQPGIIEIKKIKVMKKDLYTYTRTDQLGFSGNLKILSGSLENTLKLESNGNDPFFWTTNDLNLRGHFHLLPSNIFSLAVAFVIIYLVMQQLFSQILTRNQKFSGPVVVHYKTREFKNVEILRFLLVSFVVLEHYGMNVVGLGGKYEFFTNFISPGRSQLFFVIAGFFLFYSPRQLTNSVSYFVVKRWLRLSSLVIFATLLAYVIFHFNFTYAPLANNLLNASLLNWLKNDDYNIVGAAWYVNSLFFLSVIYFVIFKVFEKKYALFIILLFSVISVNLYARGIILGNSVIWQRIPGAVFSLSAGVFICEYYKTMSNRNVIKSKNISLSISLLELLLFTYLFIGLFCKNLGIWLENNVLSGVIIILLWLFLNHNGLLSRFFNKSWAIYFGKYTYSIFIMSEVFLRWMGWYFIPNHGEWLRDHFKWGIFIGIVGLYLFPIACHYLVEMPLSKWSAAKFLAKKPYVPEDKSLKPAANLPS